MSLFLHKYFLFPRFYIPCFSSSVRCVDFFCFHLQSALFLSFIHVHFLFLQSSERVHSDLDDEDRHMSFCASGLHPNGRCTCGTFFSAEEPSIHASIFQILMLADALFEVDFPSQILFYFIWLIFC